jgi:hypothetical protein
VSLKRFLETFLQDPYQGDKATGKSGEHPRSGLAIRRVGWQQVLRNATPWQGSCFMAQHFRLVPGDSDQGEPGDPHTDCGRV